jgi:hypothetical protein
MEQIERLKLIEDIVLKKIVAIEAKKAEKSTHKKLYLYTFFKNTVSTVNANISKLIGLLPKVIHSPVVLGAIEMFAFIVIHGAIMTPVIIMIVLWSKMGMCMGIEQKLEVLIPVTILGTGCAYRMFLDVNDELSKTWSNDNQSRGTDTK